MECKGGKVDLDDVYDARRQVEACRKLAEEYMRERPAANKAEAYLLKERGRRAWSRAVDELRKEGISIEDSPLHIS